MRAFLLLPALMLLTGCNWVMNVSGLAAESNKAVGASCRQTGRSLEECYGRNPDADKAQIYAGWREMHEYMTKNKLETMVPPPDPVPPPMAEASAAHGESAASEATAQKKSDDHAPVADAAGAAKTVPLAPAKKAGVLTNEEAEAQAKNDPLIDSILSTVRGDEKVADKNKNAPSSNDNRLLNILNDLNAPGGAQEKPAAPAKPAGSH